jgi:hypothetical protein
LKKSAARELTIARKLNRLNRKTKVFDEFAHIPLVLAKEHAADFGEATAAKAHGP